MSVNSKMEAHAARLKAGTRKSRTRSHDKSACGEPGATGYGLRRDRRTGLSADAGSGHSDQRGTALARDDTIDSGAARSPDRFRSADRNATGASGARSRTARSEAGAVDRSGYTGNAAADRNRGCAATFRSTALPGRSVDMAYGYLRLIIRELQPDLNPVVLWMLSR